MYVEEWPPSLPARAVAFDPRGMSLAGPTSMTGQQQVVSIDAGYWTARLELATLGRGDQVNAFRAMRADHEGGSNAIRVPAFDEGQAPWPAAGGAEANLNPPQPWSDGTYFSDGTGWFEPSILIVTAAAFAARSTRVTVTVTTAGTIKAGMLFSIGDRLYVIRRILDDGSWQIWPPLREAVGSGIDLNFDRPVCRMRVMSEREMDLALGRLWMASPAIGFIEVF